MPMPNQKNSALSPAATDLGLGDQLTSQVEAELAKRRKRANQLAAGMGTAVSPAATSLLSGGFNA